MFSRPIILASQSPRRSQLLMEAGFSFEVRSIDVDESYPEAMPGEEVAEFLAIKKANAAASWILSDEIVLTADTTVISNHEVFGKPIDAEDAKRMLKALSGGKHLVITGVCLMAKEMTISFSEASDVYFSKLEDAEIDYYIQQFRPYDKAGAYAIQEWIGLCKITKIVGTYSNIMGLPVNRVYEALQKFETS